MAEYIALSSALRNVIPIMRLMDELKDRGYDLISTEPIVYCKAFEDNSGALEIARLPKMRNFQCPRVISKCLTVYDGLGTDQVIATVLEFIH